MAAPPWRADVDSGLGLHISTSGRHSFRLHLQNTNRRQEEESRTCTKHHVVVHWLVVCVGYVNYCCRDVAWWKTTELAVHRIAFKRVVLQLPSALPCVRALSRILKLEDVSCATATVPHFKFLLYLRLRVISS